MTSTSAVRHGLSWWIEYDRPAFQQRVWTVSNGRASFITAFIAVVLTLATSRLFLIFQHIVDWVWSKVWPDERPSNHSDVPRPQQDEQDPHDRTLLLPSNGHHDEDGDQNRYHSMENVALNAGQSENQNRPETPIPKNLFMSKGTPQGLAWKLFWVTFNGYPRDTTKVSSNRDWGKVTLIVVLFLVSLGFFIGATIGTIYTAQIASDHVSLSTSKDCGIWVTAPSLRRLSPFNYLREMESGDYAKKCYPAQSNTKAPDTDGCNFFYSQSFRWSDEHNTSCPFADGFCLEGPTSAYTLSTGLVSSKDLGINVPIGYRFNRTTTCAPIQREGYYEVDEDAQQTYYYYGTHVEQPGSNWTYDGPKNPVWITSGYSVATFCGVSRTRGWQPIPEFQSSESNTITLMLISSQMNLHEDKRVDPIFPATSFLGVGGELYYINLETPATALACLDTTTICDAAGTTCWDSRSPPTIPPSTDIERTGYYMLAQALGRSSVCYSIELRGGNALDAQTKLDIWFSLPLEREQWKVEAQNLFTASLARAQIDLRDYAQGSAAHEAGFEDNTLPEFRDFCRRYKFKTVGWTNISVNWLFLLLGAPMLVSALSAPTWGPRNPDTPKSHEVMYPDLSVKEYLMVYERILSWLWRVLAAIAELLATIIAGAVKEGRRCLSGTARLRRHRRGS